jgi:SAM-dependent methyltransferase
MNERLGRSVFERSGLAACSDLIDPECRALVASLEREQEAFLAQESHFRSPTYKWVRDALHTWSRVWEYPYVYYHLREWLRQEPPATRPWVVDVGSGVSFFPFTVARLNCRVTCTDIDPILETDIPRALEVVSPEPGILDYRLTDGVTLPFESEQVDAVYCISVIEHTSRLDVLVREIARILKTGGLFVLTFDIGLQGNHELTVERHRDLSRLLEHDFEHVYPEQTIHPVDLLTSKSGPFAIGPPRGTGMLRFLTKQWLLKPLLGRKPIRWRSLLWLAVQGGVFRKKCPPAD